jgi:hypothetical protein
MTEAQFELMLGAFREQHNELRAIHEAALGKLRGISYAPAPSSGGPRTETMRRRRPGGLQSRCRGLAGGAASCWVRHNGALMMKTLCCTVTVLVFGVTGATAQSLEQTFDQLGSKLEAAQQSLTRPAPTPGTTFQLVEDARIYTRPDPSAGTPMKLDAKAPVTFRGVEKGFAKVTTPFSETIYYVPASALASASGQGVVGNSVKTAIETLKGIAIDLQQNPYVRVKGFSINVSIPPSLNIDFEMRDAATSSPPSAPQKKP